MNSHEKEVRNTDRVIITLSFNNMLDAFGPASFSRISDSPLEISRVVHQTFIDVQEKGTQTAAVTMAEMENILDFAIIP